MAFFKTKCNVYSCIHNREGICRKSILDNCPKTTEKNNKKVLEYNNKRKDKYKK